LVASQVELFHKVSLGHQSELNSEVDYLGTTTTTCSMQRNSFGTQKIVTWSKSGRDLDIQLSAMRVEVLRTPVVIRTAATSSVLAPSIFVDLEKGCRAISSG
jgi:hypothetical protein